MTTNNEQQAVQDFMTALSNVNKIKEYIASKDAIVQSDPQLASVINAAVGSDVTIDLVVTDGTGIVNTFNDNLEVTAVVSGSAAIAESMPIKMFAGRATITITDAVAESVELSIEDISGLDTSDIVRITFA